MIPYSVVYEQTMYPSNIETSNFLCKSVDWVLYMRRTLVASNQKQPREVFCKKKGVYNIRKNTSA